MSSALLYLAIVAVWGVVLVPMWLRRDGSRLLNRHTDLDEQPADAVGDPVVDAVAGPADAPMPATVDDAPYEEAVAAPPRRRPAHRHRVGRATVIARRRRRTTGLTLLVIGSAVTVAMGAAPWWFVLPPAAVFVGHLSLLRVAGKMDAERRRERRRLARLRAIEAERRAREAERLRMAREAEVSAEVIEMPERLHQEVYDQYTDQRAVGD